MVLLARTGVVLWLLVLQPGSMGRQASVDIGTAPSSALPPTQTATQAGYVDRFVTANGLRIHYLEWGARDKPAMILLHGISRTAHSFDHIAPHFAREYRVIAMDMRGHGDTGWDPEGAYLVEDHVKDVEALVRQLGLRSVVLLGNSTGGRVAQVYAALHPDLVTRLIVEDVGPERPEAIAAGFAKRVLEEAQLKAGTSGVAEPLLRSHAHFGTKRRSDGRIVWKRDPNLVKGFVPTELWSYVERITCPVIYILGGKSTIVPVETQERLKRTLRKCEIVTMPGLGHYPHLEDPAGYLAITDRFLAKRP
jgi:pimeloyl-ACP methyl ester carboxylesterase